MHQVKALHFLKRSVGHSQTLWIMVLLAAAEITVDIILRRKRSPKVALLCVLSRLKGGAGRVVNASLGRFVDNDAHMSQHQLRANGAQQVWITHQANAHLLDGPFLIICTYKVGTAHASARWKMKSLCLPCCFQPWLMSMKQISVFLPSSASVQ